MCEWGTLMMVCIIATPFYDALLSVPGILGTCRTAVGEVSQDAGKKVKSDRLTSHVGHLV